jgi:DNA recombination protein RmuC
MSELASALSLILNLALCIMVYYLLRKTIQSKSNENESSFVAMEKAQEKLERSVREDIGIIRREIGGSSKQNREELTSILQTMNQSNMMTLGEMGNQLKYQLATFKQELNDNLHSHQRNVVSTMGEMANQQKNSLDSFTRQLSELTTMNELKLEGVRNVVEQKLTYLQEDNNKKLEQMRLTVDEKLHATLEQRLGESFKQVSDRLEQVHKGLGEMQTLASGVGDLKRVLTNVKTRGTLGEIQLGNLLEQILSFDQYESNAITRKGSSERVEFAVKLPSKDENCLV